jgi:DNA sulfur modification protein DndE
MIVKQFRLSQQERERLIRMKAKTGISQWNILLRWAFCLSIAMQSQPIGPDIPSDSNVELDWHTFGGEFADVYELILMQKCRADGIETSPASVMRYFRAHLNRGIIYISSKNGPKSNEELLGLLSKEVSE